MNGQTGRWRVGVLATLWVGLYAASFAAYMLTEPTGDSFTRGANRLAVFAGWQLAAALVAGALWFVGRSAYPRGWQRWAMRVPLLLALILFSIPVFLIAYAWIERLF